MNSLNLEQMMASKQVLSRFKGIIQNTFDPRGHWAKTGMMIPVANPGDTNPMNITTNSFRIAHWKQDIIKHENGWPYLVFRSAVIIPQVSPHWVNSKGFAGCKCCACNDNGFVFKVKASSFGLWIDWEQDVLQAEPYWMECAGQCPLCDAAEQKRQIYPTGEEIDRYQTWEFMRWKAEEMRFEKEAVE